MSPDRRSRPWPVLAALAGLLMLGGCATSGCGATPQRLESLRRGMTPQEVAQVMGCPGTPWPRDEASTVTTLEWNGPGGLLSVVDVDFQNDRMLYYTMRTRGAW
jgi:hypothetical protein